MLDGKSQYYFSVPRLDVPLYTLSPLCAKINVTFSAPKPPGIFSPLGGSTPHRSNSSRTLSSPGFGGGRQEPYAACARWACLSSAVLPIHRARETHYRHHNNPGKEHRWATEWLRGRPIPNSQKAVQRHYHSRRHLLMASWRRPRSPSRGRPRPERVAHLEWKQYRRRSFTLWHRPP